MRQLSIPLSVPVRWAAVTVVTIVASTGCMSVGDDAGKPAPSRSATPKGSVAGPDGSTVAGTGRARTGGAEAHSEREVAESGTPSASAGPSGSPGTGSAEPRRVRGGRMSAPPLPSPEPGAPQQPDPPAPSEPQAPEPSAPPEPEPEPSEPPEVPSASPAAQLRTDAMGAPDNVDEMRTPEASPQVGPA
ncbi:hypothetical protein AB0I52_23885 [Streptomyces sp. NPDC050423]|uniref:hypothetical protein n=1 Tax=Streptomyces sp. NPDC050423 TaxID=3155402 RepID=UPI0034233CDB